MGAGFLLDCNASEIASITDKLGAVIEIITDYFEYEAVDRSKLNISAKENSDDCMNEATKLGFLIMGYNQAGIMTDIALDYIKQLKKDIETLRSLSSDTLRQARA